MKNTVKLSRSDWMRIGREAGYLKKEAIFGGMDQNNVFPMLKDDLKHIIGQMGCLGNHNAEYPSELRESAWELFLQANKFRQVLDRHGDICGS